MDRKLAILLALAACGPGELAVPDGQRCAVEADSRWCAHESGRVSWGLVSGRDVYWQVPVGAAPASGWPVAVLFQGSLHPARGFWEAERDDAFGGWHQTGLVEALLDAGYAVITPNARGGGWWDTNVAPFSLAWETAPDHGMVQALLDGIEAGDFGDLDRQRLVAGGISSGGYMTSRMALSYPGEFEALVIQSASWATCSGAVCVLPETLPEDHPPTLFLHGEDDSVVPVGTMERYADQLEDEGHEVEVVIEPGLGHAWLPDAPEAVVEWLATAP